jgi:hypothetical protein
MMLKPLAARCGKFLLIVGFTFLLVSLIPSSEYGDGTIVDYGTYRGRVFNAAGNIEMDVYTYTTNGLCFYVLTYDDLIVALEDGSLENTHPLVALEGVTNFSLVVEIPVPGLYAYLGTPYRNETVFFNTVLKQPLPHTGLLFIGMALAAGGLMLLLVIQLALRIQHYDREYKNHILSSGVGHRSLE